MNLYEVTYRENNYNDKSRTARVLASSALKATDFISKKKFLGYSGRVINILEVFSAVHVAK